MATIQVQGIYKKDNNGIFQTLRGNYVKDANGVFQQFSPGDGIKGADGNWYVLKPAVIQLAGLLWDTENIADHKTFDEANDLAASVGKRLPTQAEWAALIALPNEWDDVLKGRWFAATADDLATKDKTKCLFLPAAGFRRPSDGKIYLQGESGFYWSSTRFDGPVSYYLTLLSTGNYPATYNNNTNGYSVRCVRA